MVLASGMDRKFDNKSINATSNSTIGEISVYASNACGDGLFSTLFINVDPAMGPTINPTHVTCFGGNDGSAAGFPNGGTSPYTYSWLPQGGSNAIANSLTSGTYTVTIQKSSLIPVLPLQHVDLPMALQQQHLPVELLPISMNGRPVVH